MSVHLFRLWIECAFYTPFAFLSPLDTEHVSLVLPWIAQRIFNTIIHNTAVFFSYQRKRNFMVRIAVPRRWLVSHLHGQSDIGKLALGMGRMQRLC